MAYYKELSEIVRSVIGQYFLRNQNLCKLLYYYPEDNREQYSFDPYACPNIKDTKSKIYMKHIFPMPKLPDASLDKYCYLTVVLNGGYEADVNTGYRTVNLLIDIICHLDSYIIKNDNIRVYEIMHEIDKLLNNQLTNLPIENKPHSRGFQSRDYSNYFYGVQMLYELTINSNIICDPTPQNINIQRVNDKSQINLDALIDTLLVEKIKEEIDTSAEVTEQKYNCLPKNIGFKNGKKI